MKSYLQHAGYPELKNFIGKQHDWRGYIWYPEIVTKTDDSLVICLNSNEYSHNVKDAFDILYEALTEKDIYFEYGGMGYWLIDYNRGQVVYGFTNYCDPMRELWEMLIDEGGFISFEYWNTEASEEIINGLEYE